MSTLEKLRKERIDLLQKARDLAAENEKAGGWRDGEFEQVQELIGKAKEKGDEIARIKSLQVTSTEIGELLAADEANEVNDQALKGAQVGLGHQPSAADKFLKSDAYGALMKAHGGRISETAKGIKTDQVKVGGLKALLTGANHDTSAGALVQPQQLGVVPYPEASIGLSQLITLGTTNSDRVEYAQVLPPDVPGSTTVRNAAGVPEATDDVGTSGTKPKAALSFRKKSADVITVASWIPATKRAMSDAGQLKTLIDAFLRRNVSQETERQIISGDSENPATADTEEFDGIFNTTGVQNQEYAGSIFATARKMITKVENADGNLTGFAVSPEVAEALDLAQDNQGRFIGSGPFAMGPNTLWGRPRTTVRGLPAGKIVGGEWSTCVLWDREDTTISVTDSHLDFFVRNLLAILAEARAAFGLFNPQLMVVGDAAAPAAG